MQPAQLSLCVAWVGFPVNVTWAALHTSPYNCQEVQLVNPLLGSTISFKVKRQLIALQGGTYALLTGEHGVSEAYMLFHAVEQLLLEQRGNTSKPPEHVTLRSTCGHNVRVFRGGLKFPLWLQLPFDREHHHPRKFTLFSVKDAKASTTTPTKPSICNAIPQNQHRT